ncbi:hypothetical protein [Mesorhizobium sp.]|uniref:hypothetical protein n=1 Tax=Mesorhizobium sp. TaxID=1871066 RepID=UPI0025B945CA|nr:hypothetical protein [Mesorhizobium sp.]
MKQVDGRETGNSADQRGECDQSQVVLVDDTIVDRQHLISPDLLEINKVAGLSSALPLKDRLSALATLACFSEGEQPASPGESRLAARPIAHRLALSKRNMRQPWHQHFIDPFSRIIMLFFTVFTSSAAALAT